MDPINLWISEDRALLQRTLDEVIRDESHQIRSRRSGMVIPKDGINPDEFTIRFVCSDGKEDRDGDIIQPSGWELDNYRANPVVLFAHNSRALPVAKSLEIGIKDDRLESLDQFYTGPGPAGEFAMELFDMYAMGFMNAVSVGFRVTERPNIRRGPEDDDGYRPFLGFEFVGQELVEHSAVPVPANPRALVRAAKDGRMEKLFPVSWKALEGVLLPDLGYTRDDDATSPGKTPDPDTTAEARERRAALKDEDWKCVEDAVGRLEEVYRA